MTPCNDSCGVGSASGRNGEMLLCGLPAGHDGEHAWASLPTFVNGGFVGNPYRAGNSIKEPRASVWDEGYAAAVAAHGTAAALPGTEASA